MQKHQITGKVHSLSSVEVIGANNTKIQYLRLDCNDNSERINMPQFQAIGSRVSLLSSLKTGETITVGFALDGRDFEKDGRKGVITNLNIIEIARVTSIFIKIEEEPQATVPAPAPAEVKAEIFY